MTPRCLHCLDGGLVCEDHPAFPWEMTVEGHRADCGGAGMPCPSCCSPVPQDGTHSIAEAFTPDWQRGAVLSIAPAGSDPSDPDAWTPIGYADGVRIEWGSP
jgi:hypothetical protein